uniref:Reverse transcriptase domain-containing protein n=1 Tax=Strongyloides papillosus TaxID=174720 RepID=A0A0N5C9P5_STREA
MNMIKAKIRSFEPGSDVGPSDSRIINNHVKMLKMMTLNVRSLLHKIFELNELLNSEEIDVAFITETRWKTDECFQEEGFVYIMGKADNRNGGCGIVIKKELLKYIQKIVTQSSRITSIVMKVENETCVLTSCYFHTSAASEDEIDILYDKLRGIITDSKDRNMKCIVGGDFNAKVLFNNKNGRRLNGNVLGNERGEKLTQFCEEMELCCCNMLFNRKSNRRTTWISPNQKIKGEIDYFLSDEVLAKRIKDVRALQKHIFNSDHNPLILKLEFKVLSHRTKFKNNKVNVRPDFNKINPMKLKDIKKKLNWDLGENAEQNYDTIRSNLTKIYNECKIKEIKSSRRITDDPKIKSLLIKRKNLKSKGLNYTILSKLIRFEISDLCLKRTNLVIDKAIKEGRSMKYVFKETARKKFNNIIKDSVNKIFGEIFGKEREESIEWRNYVKKDSKWHPITPEGVSFRIKKSKRKACGPDGIFLEHLILGGRKAAEALATLFNKHGHLIPDQMNECNIVLIKKPSNKIENCISSSQAGFFRKRNTLNQILEFCTIIQTSREYKKDLYAIFIDIRKAFDSVNHSWLLYSLAINNFDEELVKRIEALYRSPKATFSTGINNSYTTIEVKSGIRQGDTLSPKLFILLLEIILKNAQHDLDDCFKNEESNLVKIMIDGTPTVSFKLEFADDKVIYTYDQKLTEKIAHVIEYHARKTGLELNKDKTKMMATQYKKKLDNPIYEVVSNYKYLGRVVSMDLNGDNNDFNERAKATWRARFKNKELLNRADYKNKLRIYNCIIRPATLYKIHLAMCIKDIILDRMEKARKPFDVYVEKDWKRPVGRPPKRLLSLVPDNSTIRKQPDRKAKLSLNVNIYKRL